MRILQFEQRPMSEDQDNVPPELPMRSDAGAADEPAGLEIDERQIKEMRSIFGSSLPQYIEPLDQMCAQILSGTGEPEILGAFNAAAGSLREAGEKLGFRDVVDTLTRLQAAVGAAAERRGVDVPRDCREEVLGLLDDLRQLAEDMGASRAAVSGRPILERLTGMPEAAKIASALARAGLVLDEQLLAGRPEEIAAVSGLSRQTVDQVLDRLGAGKRGATRGQAPLTQADESRQLLREIADLEAAIERLGSRLDEVRRDLEHRRGRIEERRREQAAVQKDLRNYQTAERELESWFARAAKLQAQLGAQRELYASALQDAKEQAEHWRKQLRGVKSTLQNEEAELSSSRNALRELETLVERIRGRVDRSPI